MGCRKILRVARYSLWFHRVKSLIDPPVVNMPVNPKSKSCVGDEMRRWKEGKLHSGIGKEGKEGPVVKDKKQAIAIALSVCGKSNYAETLMALGFSEESAKKAAKLLGLEPDWDNQFAKGDTLAQLPREDKKTIAPSFQGFDIDNRPGLQPGKQGRSKGQDASQGIYPSMLPQGNPQQGPRSRSDLTGLAAFSATTKKVR